MGDKAFEYEVPTGRHSRPEISAGPSDVPPKNSINEHVQKMTSDAPEHASTFLIKAKAWGILIGAITGGVAGIWSAVRKPDTIQAKQGYEALTKAVDKQGNDINKNHDDIVGLYAYLKAWQDLQSKAQLGPVSTPVITVPSSPPVALAPGLRPIHPMAVAPRASASAMVIIPVPYADLPALAPPSPPPEAPALPKFDTFK